jgi:hypothetical protein
VSGGSKLQVAYKRRGNYVYPQDAMQSRVVQLGEPYELTIRVRGPILNVAVNGEHMLAYRLPAARQAGDIELVTYDCRAQFTGFALAELPAELVLLEPSGTSGQVSNLPLTVAQARAALQFAEKTFAAAQLQPATLQARAAADRARHRQPPAENVREFALLAARSERAAAVASAEVELARAEVELTRAANPETEKKVSSARDALTAARKALESSDDSYTPLRGSLKTLETNIETEESRNKPFPITSTGRRTALARWITDPTHPLTARVAVNHIWARHFGRPLVETVFDFGLRGSPPTHPELLDWLAVEFMTHDWSMRHLHRLIVTSNTYRMSSSPVDSRPLTEEVAGPRARTSNRDVDPENRYYWRMNWVRMDAQSIRDSLLYLGNELDLASGGSPVAVSDESARRRSLYFVHSHNEHHKFLSMFDDASVLECYRRSESIVPQQALAMANSSLPLSSAELIARRLSDQLPQATDSEFVRAAFETVLGVAPTDTELAECQNALREMMELARTDKQPDVVLRARTNITHALLNHNDFITIR